MLLNFYKYIQRSSPLANWQGQIKRPKDQPQEHRLEPSSSLRTPQGLTHASQRRPHLAPRQFP